MKKKGRSITKIEGGKKLHKHTQKTEKLSGYHIMCRGCLLRLIVEGKIRVKQRGERRSKELLNDIKETRSERKNKGESTRSQRLNISLLKKPYNCCRTR